MKYIIIGFEGFIFNLASHLQDEGQDILAGQIIDAKDISVSKKEEMHESAVDKKQRLTRYDGIVEKMPIHTLLKKLSKVSHPEEYFVICESNTMFLYAKYLQELGFHGMFPTKEDRLFEIDRSRAKDFVKENYPHLKVAKYFTFSSVQDALRFLKSQRTKLWVLKGQNDDIATVVPSTDDPTIARKQLIENLEIHKEGYERSGFLLEEKIQNIIELTPEKMYYDGKPLGMSIMFENKFIGSANISFQVTCAGDMVFPVSFDSPIHDICFPPIVDELAKQHKGLFIWDASILVNSKTNEMYFGEFCPNRFGFDSFLTTLEQMPSVHYFFERVVLQENPFTPGTIGVSLMLFNLLQDPVTHNYYGDVAVDFPPEIKKHVWPYDVCKKEDGNYYSIGYDKLFSPITASEKTLMASVDTLYKYVEQFNMSNVYYRPKFDFLSRDYSTSLLNRLEYCVDKKMFKLPFSI